MRKPNKIPRRHYAVWTGRPKRAFASWEEAERVAFALSEDGQFTAAYRCSHCGAYHVGRDRQMINRRRFGYRGAYGRPFGGDTTI